MPPQPPASPQNLGADVVRRCRALGFAEAGICVPGPIEHGEELRAWLAAGKQGSMDWFAESLHHRLDPRGLMPSAKAMIVVADQYAPRGTPEDAAPAPGFGLIARYARGRDYHRVIKDRLKKLTWSLADDYPGHRFRSMVDIMPLHEREMAAKAGIGWVAKNTLIIHRRQGSWLLLGCVLTDMDLAPPAEQKPEPDHCGTCTRCIDACPTQAITPYSVDASRCISYLTIERKAPIPESFHAAIGDWAYGCDICQEVCPHNASPDRAPASPDRKGAGPPPIHAHYSPRTPALNLSGVLSSSSREFDATFKGSAIRRVTIDQLKRNALIVATNQLSKMPPPQRAEWRNRLSALESDPAESDLVRATARQSLQRLSSEPPAAGA